MKNKNIDTLITDNLDLWTSAIENRSASGRGSSKKINLYGIKKLRELILELAVRGKLVPQDPDDEPASVLLERIPKEKEKLIKEGKIKKQKKLPEIGEDEKPFELPDGWEWTRLGSIIEFINGYAFKSSDFTEAGLGIVKIGDIQEGVISTDKISRVSKDVVNSISNESIKVEKNDLLIAMSGATTGKLGFNRTDEIFYLNQRVGKILPYEINKDYLYYPLTTKIAENLAKSMGSAIPNLSTNQINNIIITIPPLPEQHRIVTKVDSLMSLCDKLEQQTEDSITAHQTLVETLLDTLTQSLNAEELAQNWNRISEHFDTLFTTEQSIDSFKQTILQLAVMGKLVKQDPNDEPASVLLEKIAKEKEKLVKEGKIKKQKKLPEIGEDEKPFELPVGWEWCRFEDVVNIQSGITKGRKLAGRELVSIPYLRVANVQRGFLELAHIKEVQIPKEEVEKYAVFERDLLITEGGDWDKVGRTAIWKNELPYIAHQNHVFKARTLINIQNEIWLEKYLNSKFARDYFAGSSKQTTNLASINKTQLRGCIIAIPSLSEQNRIVAKLGELISLCDQLKEKLSSVKDVQLSLADSVVESLLE